MSLIKFELKEDHLKLIRAIKWDNMNFPHTGNDVNENSPFGGDNLGDDAYTILYGKPDDVEIGATSEDYVKFDAEKVEIMKKLYEEIPMVLEIVFQLNTFEPGFYQAKYHDRLWKRIR